MEFLTLALLVGLAAAAVRVRDLLASVAILGAYSFTMAFLWCLMNALDVAFTEAAVGAGISTVLMVAAIFRVGRAERRLAIGPMLQPGLSSMQSRRAQMAERKGVEQLARVVAVMVCLLVAAALVYGTRDMPRVGDPNAPANIHPQVARRYIDLSPTQPDGTPGEVGPANIVTSVLGDYRGYDTMGEVVVICTAALCVMLLLRRRRREDEEDGA